MQPECVLDASAELGEATVWDMDRQRLWWVDIVGKTVNLFDPDTLKNERWVLPKMIGCLGLRESGGLIITMSDGFYFFDPDTGENQLIVEVDADDQRSRLNDGKTDRQGNFWCGGMFEVIGTPTEEVQAIGSLYRLGADLKLQKMETGIKCSNGLAWSPDSTIMYFTDSYTNFVWQYDHDPKTGELRNRRVFIDMSETSSIVDGATVDADGCYWATIPFGWRVEQYDPAGKLMQTIRLPTKLPTSCEFGGRNLDRLFITTAIYHRDPAELVKEIYPGGLFVVETQTRGLPSVSFKG